MMKKYKDLFCNSTNSYRSIKLFHRFTLVILCAIIVATITGCKKTENVQFCEGVDTDGVGVNCGKVFEPGDLTVRFQHSSAFETDSIRMKFYDVNSGSSLPVETKSIEVKPDSNVVTTELALYDQGVFKVTFETRDGTTIGEGTVEMADNIKDPD